jgi:hypothetical protein
MVDEVRCQTAEERIGCVTGQVEGSPWIELDIADFRGRMKMPR